MSKITTPCEKICVVDQDSGLCLGCGRSIPEIERWSAIGESNRLRIMSELSARLDALWADRANRAQS
jgi:predicted Fe-S protein YdhL (DUF1289 family)